MSRAAYAVVSEASKGAIDGGGTELGLSGAAAAQENNRKAEPPPEARGRPWRSWGAAFLTGSLLTAAATLAVAWRQPHDRGAHAPPRRPRAPWGLAEVPEAASGVAALTVGAAPVEDVRGDVRATLAVRRAGAGGAKAQPSRAATAAAAGPAAGAQKRSLTWARSFPTGSLFCFSLLDDPHGSESRLLALQWERRAGPFGCDESAVWSAEEFQVAPGLRSAALGQRLSLGGGPSSEALARLWGAVVADGRFRSHAWAVRVDPDCVFFPGRLRWLLNGRLEEPDNGTYMTGCSKDDSPIQVLSRRAVEAFAAGVGLCEKSPGRFHTQPSGNEDAAMDWCLTTVLGVQQISDRRLLLGPRCGARASDSCAQGHVAFYPFKTEQSYNRCASSAHSAALARIAV